MIENLYRKLVSKGRVSVPFEVFAQAFNNDPNYRAKILSAVPELTLPQEPKYQTEPKQKSQEEKYLVDEVPFIGDFIGDLYRAAKQGTQAAASVDESIDLMKGLFGDGASDEQIQNFITAYNQSSQTATSDEMMSFNKIYEEEGKGVWGFLKGVADSPSIIPQLFVSSMATMVGSAVDSDDVRKLTLGGAAAGSFAGPTGIFAGGVGALATGMEAALTFGELLKEEVGEGNFKLENIKAIFEDPDKVDSLLQKSVARGIAIGAFEALAGSVAGKTVKALTLKSKAGAAAAGVGVEAVGGSLGEVAGRLAADQEMDVAEIGFEGIAGTTTAPVSVGLNIAQPGTYKINNESYSAGDFVKNLNLLDATALRAANIEVQNNEAVEKLVKEKRQEALYDIAIGEEVTDTKDRKEIVELEKQHAKIKDQTSVAGNIRAAKIKNQINAILSKYDGTTTTKDVISAGAYIRKTQNLSDNLAKTEAFADLLKIGFKSLTNEEYVNFIDKYNTKHKTNFDATGEGRIIQDSETGEQTIIINKDEAAKSDQFTVGQHELLHGLLHQTLKNNDETAIRLGQELGKYLNKINVKEVKDSRFRERLKAYKYAEKAGQLTEAERYEEVLTLTSEAMANKELKYDQTTFDKIADLIRQFLRKHFNVNMELNTAEDVFNLLKDYNKSFEEGKLYKSFGRLSTNALQGKLISEPALQTAKRIYDKKKISNYDIENKQRKEIVNRLYEQKGKAAIDEVIPYYMPKIEAVVNQRRDYSMSDLSTFDIAEEKSDIVMDTMYNLLLHARAFNPTKNDDFDAYINSYIVQKFGTAVKKLQRTETKVTETQERKARQKGTLDTITEQATTSISDKIKIDPKVQEKLNTVVKSEVTNILKQMTIGTKPRIAKLNLQDTFRQAIRKDLKNTIKKKEIYEKFLKDNFETYFNDVNVETLNKRFRGDKSNPDLFVKPTGKRVIKTATSQPQLFEKQPWDQVKGKFLNYFLDGPASRVGVRKDKIVEEISNYMAFELARQITSSPDIFNVVDEIGITKLDNINKERVESIVKDTRDVTNIRTKLKIAMTQLSPTQQKYQNEIISVFRKYQPVDMRGNVSDIYEAVKKRFLAKVPEEDRADVEAFMSDREYMIAKPGTGLFVANVKKTHDKGVIEELYKDDKATAPTTEEQVKETTDQAIRVIKSIPPQTLKQIFGDKITLENLTFVGLKDTNMGIDGLPWTLDVQKKKPNYVPDIQTDKPYKYGSNANPYLIKALDVLYEQIGKADNPNNKPDKLWDGLGIDKRWNFKDYAPINKSTGLIAKISKDLASNSKNNQQEIIDKYKKDITIANQNNPKVQAYMQLKFAESYKQGNITNKASNIRLLQGTTNATASFVKALAKIKYIHILNGQSQSAPTSSSLWGYIEHLKENANTLTDFNDLNIKYYNDEITQDEYMKQALDLANEMEISYNDTDLSVEQLDKKFNKNLGQGDFKLRALDPSDLDNFINIETGQSANTELAEKMFFMEENNKLMVRGSKRSLAKISLPNEQMKRFKQYDKALEMANRLNPPEKGISILDFDDTLAKTKSKVLYTLPDGTKGKIDATAFATESAALEAAGAKFDFSEFSKVKAGKKGPFFGKALDLIGKYGNKDMFILTARPADAAPAIQKFLKAVGLNIRLENIIGLEDGRPEAKAEFIVDKAAEGYNNFLFADDAVKNVDAVSEVLDSLDINGKVYKVKQDFRQDMDKKFNKILEQVKGIDRNATFSDAAARVRGALNDKFWSRLFVPPGADDFKGLMYYFMGKGKIGEAHAEFFNETLFKPFAKATKNINAARQRIVNEYSQLTKDMPAVKKMLLTATGYSNFTYDQAMRVYLMNQNNIDIPGLSKRDLTALLDIVNSDPSLVAYADKVSAITRLDEGYVQPDDVSWLASTIELDLRSITTITKRAEYLTEWKANKDAIFTPDNLNKIEAIYGASVRSALEDSLYRMEIGTNRPTGQSKIASEFTDWANGAVGNIMFFNIRSAVLQTISFANFVNWSDNNPYKYMKAVGNFPQFAKDFAMIWNSDFLKSRRQGLQTDVNASEIINEAANSKNKVKSIIAYILGKGYLPTQMGDSFAICMGGAGFYRNRLDTYLKQGLSLKEAETKAFSDMQETSEDAQQSARPDKISQQQASEIGRWILSFQNTPMQYTRIIKKAALDLANKRGDAKTNISKIIYYGALQNLIFTSLQSAIFALAFDDDEDKEKEKYARIANSMVDTILRGTGIYGAVAAMLKNVALEFVDQNKKGYRADHAYTVLEAVNLSPALGSKTRKVYSATQAVKFNSDEMISRGFHIDNPAYEAVANVTSAAINLPVDRALRITDNLREATNKENQAWQRIALALGWSTWDVGIEGERRKKDKKKKGGVNLF
jgi:hypothetical protein